MAKAKVKINEFIIIEELFKEQNWEIERDRDLNVSLFNKYIDRYERVEYDSRDLYLDLSRRFLRIKDRDVYSMFKDVYNNIYDDFLSDFDRIHFLPLVNPYIKVKKGKTKVARPKTKSGEKIKMFIEVNEYRELKYSKKIILQDNFDFLSNSFNEKKDLLILVDDFIGSGRTANDVLKVIFNNQKFHSNNTIILTLVAQDKGVNKIYETNNVVTFFKHLMKRAISDYYQGKEIKQNLDKNLSMENSIKCPEEWRLGYEKTEALVSIMNKSPNNTLPIFWFETKNMVAPFQRYFNYR